VAMSFGLKPPVAPLAAGVCRLSWLPLVLTSICVFVGASGAPVNCYKLLGASAGDDEKELKRAYRREALKWHPDKNSSPEAEERFREVARCYEQLTTPGGAGHPSASSSSMQEYDTGRAFRTFEDLFGDVHKRWRPGMTVSGTIAAGGKKVKITIHPDGSTEEHEGQAKGSYSTLYQSDGTSTSFHIEGDPRELVVDFMKSWLPLPSMLMPMVSMVIFTLCNPLLCCAGWFYCCCWRDPSKPRTD